MKSIALLLTTVFFVASSCNKDIASNIPDCIKKEIKSNRSKNDWIVGSVEEYLFQGKLVYAFNPDNKIIADGSSIIKDGACNTICSVGGFGGPNVDFCNGDRFNQTAILKRTIWEK